MGSFAIGYERFCRMLLMVFIVNIAIVVHTIIGIVILGLFPSIAAAYATYRTWLLSDDKGWTVRETWTTFHAAWREDIISASLFGWAQTAVFAVLAYSYWLVLHNDMGTLGYAASGVLLLALVFMGLFSFLSWVVRANFAEPNRWAVRMTLQMIIARPICSLLTILLFLLTICIWALWPGILMVFGISVPIGLMMVVAYYYGRLPGMTPPDKPVHNKREAAQ